MIHYIKGMSRLPKVLTSLEKLILTGALLTVLIAGGLWWYDTIKAWSLQPVQGGSYTEGIIRNQPYDLDLTITKLTKVGLTYIDNKQELKGALAEKWEVADDGKKYTFFLRPGVKNQEVADLYSVLPNWQNVSVSTGENNTLTMTLKQPFAPLLSFTSDPVIAPGPYELEKQTNTELIFTANSKFPLGEPHLQRIILKLYPDERTLKAALQRQEIMGADAEIKGVSGTASRKLQLAQQEVLIFNLERDIFKDKKVREQIRDKKKLDTPLKATLVTSQEPELLAKANTFAEEAAKIDLTVSIKSLNAVSLDRDILPDREFDLLFTTINYGYDGDPYPFWHSSQVIIPGKNYAGYNSKEADKIMEAARQTLDQGEREKKYKEFQHILESDIPAIFYPKQEFRYTVSGRLKGVNDRHGVVMADRFSESWHWFIKQKRQK